MAHDVNWVWHPCSKHLPHQSETDTGACCTEPCQGVLLLSYFRIIWQIKQESASLFGWIHLTPSEDTMPVTWGDSVHFLKLQNTTMKRDLFNPLCSFVRLKTSFATFVSYNFLLSICIFCFITHNYSWKNSHILILSSLPNQEQNISIKVYIFKITDHRPCFGNSAGLFHILGMLLPSTCHKTVLYPLCFWLKK